MADAAPGDAERDDGPRSRQQSTAPSEPKPTPSVPSGEPKHPPRSRQGSVRPSLAPEAHSRHVVLDKFCMYETKTRLYIVASNQSDSRHRVLKIDRVPGTDDGTPGGELNIVEDVAVYTDEQIKQLLAMIDEGNKPSGGLVKSVPLFYGIVGFIRFTAGWHVVLIKQRAAVALLGGCYIFHCEETVLLPVTVGVKPANSAEEARLLASFQQVDLSKNFYFSYCYDLTNTLQINLTRQRPAPGPSDDPPIPETRTGPVTAWGYNDKFVWNNFLLRSAFRGMTQGSSWVLPIIHGFVDQAKISCFSRNVYVTLIARRSRHFAGARFLKRGINELGYVANDVETEQIVGDGTLTPFHRPAGRDDEAGRRVSNPHYTSYVQHRGSIPLYWTQDATSMGVKPPIELGVADPYFAASALHFDDLFARYGTPVIVLNLIKENERIARESKLLEPYAQCIRYLNQFLPPEHHIRYETYDIAAAKKKRGVDVIGVIEDIAEEVVERTGMFHSGAEPFTHPLDPGEPAYRTTPLMQSGVCRTNCIDCIDRTNAVQFIIGKTALSHQLHKLGILRAPSLPFESDAINLLTEMYHDHGDTLALQYGGSQLVNTIQTYAKINQYRWTSHSRDMIAGLKRYYSNSFIDADKQHAINLFLGVDVDPLGAGLVKPARRSYRQWFTPANLIKPSVPNDIRTIMGSSAMRFGDYWLEYYRPRVFTDISRHFAFKVNSTNRYLPTDPNAVLSDFSPFVKRETAEHPTRCVFIYVCVRRWISTTRRPPLAPRRAILSDVRELREEPIKPARRQPGPTTTEGLALSNLWPEVAQAEAEEYDSYIRQFNDLTFAQSLAEKDLRLYINTTSMVGRHRVDQQSLSTYEAAYDTAYNWAGSATSPLVGAHFD